jgi:hypothetical protein
MTYKLDISSIVYKLLIITFLFSLIFYSVFDNFNVLMYLILFLFLLGLEVLLFFFRNFLFKIVINYSKGYIQLYFKKNLIYNYFIEVPINELCFSYNEETGARGIKSKKLRLYKNNKEEIITIGSGFDGWEEKTVQEIVKKFRELKILEFKRL